MAFCAPDAFRWWFRFGCRVQRSEPKNVGIIAHYLHFVSGTNVYELSAQREVGYLSLAKRKEHIPKVREQCALWTMHTRHKVMPCFGRVRDGNWRVELNLAESLRKYSKVTWFIATLQICLMGHYDDDNFVKMVFGRLKLRKIYGTLYCQNSFWSTCDAEADTPTEHSGMWIKPQLMGFQFVSRALLWSWCAGVG